MLGAAVGLDGVALGPIDGTIVLGATLGKRLGNTDVLALGDIVGVTDGV